MSTKQRIMSDLTFQIKHIPQSKTIMIQAIGELCGMEAINFKNRIKDIIKHVHSDIVVDLNKLSGMDLTGFNAIVAALLAAKRKNQLVHVLGSENAAFKQLLVLANLESHICAA